MLPLVTCHHGQKHSEPSRKGDNMNKIRRKQIEKALGMLADARSILDECREDEQDAFDNMPESIQDSDRGEQMNDYIYTLEDVVSSLEEFEEQLTEIVEQ